MLINNNITPFQTIKTAVSAQMNFVHINFTLSDYAYGRVSLLDENNNVVSTHDVPFTLEELNNWGTDDNYVLELGLQKLGILFE